MFVALPLTLAIIVPALAPAVAVELVQSPSDEWAAVALAIRTDSADPELAAGLAALERAGIERRRGRARAFVHADAIVVVDEVHPSDLNFAIAAMQRRVDALKRGAPPRGAAEDVHVRPLPRAAKRAAHPPTVSEQNVRLAIAAPNLKLAARLIGRRPVRVAKSAATEVKFPGPLTRLHVRAQPRSAGASAYAVDMVLAARLGAELWLEQDRSVLLLDGEPRALSRSSAKAQLESAGKSPLAAAHLHALWALRAPFDDVLKAIDVVDDAALNKRAANFGVRVPKRAAKSTRATESKPLKVAGAFVRPGASWLSYTVALSNPKAPVLDARRVARSLDLRSHTLHAMGAEVTARAIPGALLVTFSGPARLKGALENAVRTFDPEQFASGAAQAQRSALSLTMWQRVFGGAFRAPAPLTLRTVFVDGSERAVAPKVRAPVAFKDIWRPLPGRFSARALPLDPRIDRAGRALARLVEQRDPALVARYERGPRGALISIRGQPTTTRRPPTRAQLRAALEHASKDHARGRARVGAASELAAERFINHAADQAPVQIGELLRLSQVLLEF